jgi:hypothetical protein
MSELERVINGMDIEGIHPSLKLVLDTARRQLALEDATTRIDYEKAELLFEGGGPLDWLNDGSLVVDVLVRKIVDAALGDSE